MDAMTSRLLYDGIQPEAAVVHLVLKDGTELNPLQNRESVLLDVIIPFHDAMRTLPALVDSLRKTDRTRCRILFVDDASSDSGAPFIESSGFDILKLDVNAGPAAARNRGLAATNAPFVLFADSDIVIKSPDAFQLILTTFAQNPAVTSIATISEPLPENSGFLSAYTALSEYIIFDRVIRGRTFVDPWPELSTRFGAFTRASIEAVNGFDESIPVASVEDADLFYKLMDRGFHGVLLNSLKIGHNWPTRWTRLIRAWITRARIWSRMFRKRKQFDEIFITRREATSRFLDCLAALLLAFSIPFHIVLWIFIPIEIIALTLKTGMFVTFRRFHGIGMALGALFTSQLNSVALGVGILLGTLDEMFGKSSA